MALASPRTASRVAAYFEQNQTIKPQREESSIGWLDIIEN